MLAIIWLLTFHIDVSLAQQNVAPPDSIVSQDEMTYLTEKLFRNYNKKAIPIVNGQPIEVKVKLGILDMVPKEHAKLHFSMDSYIQYRWIDPRLKFNFTKATKARFLAYDWRVLEDLWTPNLYFIEAKFGMQHEIPDPNLLVFISPNGEVLLHRRLSITSFCPMKLEKFPFDVQHCSMTIEPYSYHTVYLRLAWDHLTWLNLELQDFADVSIKMNSLPFYKYTPISEKSWSRLVVKFQFRRNIDLYLFRDFLPCIFIVALSWINFWVNYRSTPARVLLSITTVLTIVTMTNQIRLTSPSEELFRSIDYYMMFCNLFVFAALLETTMVGMTAPNSKPADRLQQIMDILQNDDDDDDDETLHETHEKPTADGNEGKQDDKKATINEFPLMETFKLGPLHFYKGETHNVDKYSRILFPLSFMFFNIAFFVAHLFDNTVWSTSAHA